MKGILIGLLLWHAVGGVGGVLDLGDTVRGAGQEVVQAALHPAGGGAWRVADNRRFGW